MVDFFKELAYAANARIRSPFLGSIALVFLTFNWQAIAVLLFANGSIERRLMEFDSRTTDWSLVVFPILGGVSLALVLPWLKLLGATVAKFPAARLNKLQHDESQSFRIYRLNKEADEAEAVARRDEAVERGKINSAKRLEEAREVEPDLEEELKKDRKQAEENEVLSEVGDIWERELLQIAATSSDGKFLLQGDGIIVDGAVRNELTNWTGSHRDRKLFEALVQRMQLGDLLDYRTDPFGDGPSTYEITASGYQKLRNLST